MQLAAAGLALRRFGSIGFLQTAQIPYVPVAMFTKAFLISL
jgi:hypothetical protein